MCPGSEIGSLLMQQPVCLLYVNGSLAPSHNGRRHANARRERLQIGERCATYNNIFKKL